MVGCSFSSRGVAIRGDVDRGQVTPGIAGVTARYSGGRHSLASAQASCCSHSGQTQITLKVARSLWTASTPQSEQVGRICYTLPHRRNSVFGWGKPRFTAEPARVPVDRLHYESVLESIDRGPG